MNFKIMYTWGPEGEGVVKENILGRENLSIAMEENSQLSVLAQILLLVKFTPLPQ